MIEIAVTQEMRDRAETRAKKLGALRNSVTEGESNVVGFIGEELFLVALDGSESSDTYEFDARYQGLRIDVKSYKCKHKPKPHFECTVYAFNTEQATDFYVFVRVKKDLSVGWVLGCMEKSEFYNTARFGKKGDIVEGQFAKGKPFRYKADCYHVAIIELNPLSVIENSLW